MEITNEEEALAAVRNRDMALRFVPENFKTAELCLEAVKSNGHALDDVPEEYMTVELCFEAVKHDSYALYNVPENLKTAELCHEAVKKAFENFLEIVLIIIPEALRDEIRARLKSGE